MDKGQTTPLSAPPRGPERWPTRRIVSAAVKSIVAFVVLPIVMGAAVLTILFNNVRFHTYLIHQLQVHASASLGVPVTLQNIALHLSTLSVDLYGITVVGAAPYTQPALLQVPHVEVGVGIISIFHGKWYLSSFRLDRPVVQIFVDSHGISNLPSFKSSKTRSDNTIFDLGIRHAVLDGGELFYNNRPSNLTLDLHDVALNTSFNMLLQKYSGTVAYADGRVTYGSLQPPPHNVSLSFDATPSTFHLSSVKVISGNSQLTLSGTMTNYSNPGIQAQFAAIVDGSQLATILHNPSLPMGMISARGDVQYQQSSHGTLLDFLRLDGYLTSPHLSVKTITTQTEIGNLSAHYSLANGDAILHDLQATLLGGHLNAQGTMKSIGGDTKSHVEAALNGISLSSLRHALGAGKEAPDVTVDGTLNATATATWGKTLDNILAHADANLSGRVKKMDQKSAAASGPTPTDTNGNTTTTSTVPVQGMIHATYYGEGQRLAVENSYLRTQETNLAMNGTISSNSSLAIQLQANDLREAETVADIFRTPHSDGTLSPLGLGGTASFRGLIKGSATAPHLTGQLTAQNSQLSGTTWKVVRTSVDASPSRIALQDSDLEPASRGKIAFNASMGLTRWSYSSGSPLQIQMTASQLNVADLIKLSGQNIPATGSLNANLEIHGSLNNPDGAGSITLTNLVAYGEPISSVTAHFSGAGNEAHIDVSARAPAGSLESKVVLRPQQRSYTAQVTSSGIQLDKLQSLMVRNTGVSGVVQLNATGQGTFDNPQMEASLQIPNLVVQDQAIKDIHLNAKLANNIATVDLTSMAMDTSIRAHGTVNLTGDFSTDASLDTQSVPLAPLLTDFAPQLGTGVTGQTEIHATLRGPLKATQLLEAHATIPILKLAYGNDLQLAAAAPIHIDYKNGVVEVQRAEIKGSGTDMNIQGSIPTKGDTPATLSLKGTANLQLAQLFDPDIRSSGEIRFNVDTKGVIGNLNLGGTVEIVDANLASAAFPAGIQHLNGSLQLSSDRINIAKMQGTVGGGTISAQGGVALRPGVQFELGMGAQGVRLLYPHGMRESLDANLRFTGTTDAAQLGGSVNINDLSFARDFDLSTLIAELSGGVETPPSRGFAHNVALNLAVRSSNNVNLVSRSLSVGGSANLQVRGTLDEPVILGRANLTGGDIILNGNRFVLSGGTVQFINPSKTEPVVNLTLSTSIQQYNINLRFTGPVEQLHTQYSSDPSLPSADIINLLAFGQTTNANQATPTSQAAESMVASQVSSQVTSRFSKIAGISQLSINPVLASSNSQGPPGATVTIQQRVTGNLFITFSTNVASTQGQTIQGQYRLSPRVSVSATRDPNGGVAVDTIIKKSW